MGLLIRHLRHRGVSHGLQMQVRKYFEYWHQSKDENDGEQCDQMIDNLSNNLRKEVQNDIRIRLINQMPILKNNFSPSFLKSIANHIKTKRTKPEEILIEEQQVNDKLYFLVNGQMNSFISIKKDDYTTYTAIKSIKPNSIFDQISFMADFPCLTGYRSIGSCTLYYINKEDFVSDINNFPQDHEKYQLIKDNIIVYRSQRNIGTKCNFCKKLTHSFDRCPFIKYIPYSEKSLIIYRASIEQVRMPSKRRDTTIQTLTNCRYSKERVVYYLIENNPYLNEDDLIERLQLVNYGEEEFNQLYNNTIDHQTNRTNLTNIIEERYNHNNHNNNNQDENENNMELNQNSIIFYPELQSPLNKASNNPHNQSIGNNPNIFCAHKMNTNQDSSIVQGENSIFLDAGIHTQKNNSNLNTIFSNGFENQQQQQQQPQQSQNQYNVFTLENNNTEVMNNNNNQDHNQISQQTGNQNTGAQIKKMGIIIAKSPKQKKQKNVDMSSLTVKQKELLGQVNQPGMAFTNAIALQIMNQISVTQPNQPATSQKYSYEIQKSLNNRKRSEELELKGTENDNISISSPDQIFQNQIIHQQNQQIQPITLRKKSIKGFVVEHQSHEESSMGGLEKKVQMRKNSEKRNQTINNLGLQISLNNIEQHDIYQNGGGRRNSTATNQISLQHLQNNLVNINSLQQLQNQQNSLQLQPQNPTHAYHNQMSLAVSMIQKLHFMPIATFDKMKEFQFYYPSGNYTKVIGKIDSFYSKRAEKQGKEKNKFKRSVNKIMQICQLQNMILKKSIFPSKVSTPSQLNKKNSTLNLQDSFRNPKIQALKQRAFVNQQPSFSQGFQQSSFSTQV